MKDVDALTTIITALKELSPDEQERVLHAAVAFLRIRFSPESSRRDSSGDALSFSARTPPSVYSEDRTISPKDFIKDKSPQTDADRVVVLAYYLARYRDLPEFKILDLSALNTEAAQPKFANASVAVDSAMKAGFLVQVSKSGAKKISAAGEKFVQLLPGADGHAISVPPVRARKKVKKVGIRKLVRKKPLI